MPQIQEDRPPYVTFEVRPEEDRQASIDAGHFVAKDVVYALITPMGSKDRIERIADDWMQKLETDTREGRFKLEWLRHFKELYRAFQENREAPINGFPLKQWPVATPAQILTLERLHVRSVEDLANANEEVLGRVGMGGRALKQKAIDWLASASGEGKLSEKLSALSQKLDEVLARNTALEAENQRLQQALGETGKPPANGSRKSL